jgi:SM-20-related protein
VTDTPEPLKAAAGKGPMPPHVQLTDVLGDEDREQLLEWAIASQAKFKPAKVYKHAGDDGSRLDPEQRTALKLRDFGPLTTGLQKALLAHLPEIMAGTGYRGPPPQSLELELNAYGDGGHFGQHIDISTGPGRRPLGEQPGEDRVLSAVYYFYKEPKAFSGGALKLFRFGAYRDNVEERDVVAYEPRQNSLVAFPSWVTHEVDTVRCPSGRFEDYRFALNCWFCRTIGG